MLARLDRLPDVDRRDALIGHLKAHGILAVFHYTPLNVSQMGREHGGGAGDCPVAEDVSNRIVRLPFFNDLAERDQRDVIDAVRSFGT